MITDRKFLVIHCENCVTTDIRLRFFKSNLIDCGGKSNKIFSVIESMDGFSQMWSGLRVEGMQTMNNKLGY